MDDELRGQHHTYTVSKPQINLQIEHQTAVGNIYIWNGILEVSMDIPDQTLGDHYDWWVGTTVSKLLFSH